MIKDAINDAADTFGLTSTEKVDDSLSMIDPDLKDLSTPAGLILGSQVTLFM